MTNSIPVRTAIDEPYMTSYSTTFLAVSTYFVQLPPLPVFTYLRHYRKATQHGYRPNTCMKLSFPIINAFKRTRYTANFLAMRGTGRRPTGSTTEYAKKPETARTQRRRVPYTKHASANGASFGFPHSRVFACIISYLSML